MAAPVFKDDLVTRREAIRRVSALLGGAALIGQSAWLTGCSEGLSASRALFPAHDVALLDEIADTILPETKTPGAKAAGVGAFIATMVTDTYDPREQRVFRDGLEELERESKKQNGGGFMASSPAQRLALLERIDREAIEFLRGNFDRPHYFRMIKELTLLGYFTSEIGYTQAQRYVESPGRFDACITYTVGDKAWAPHA
ncbi:MAG TPA: gluconate 2-dehydrogenase subunit 3 family protein [Gammaproteobacteria bacterium]|nr:gluconate 2-dehydrogenase subunit 3 family protein [Gammaproteobacteria bacterium]